MVKTTFSTFYVLKKEDLQLEFVEQNYMDFIGFCVDKFIEQEILVKKPKGEEK